MATMGPPRSQMEGLQYGLAQSVKYMHVCLGAEIDAGVLPSVSDIYQIPRVGHLRLSWKDIKMLKFTVSLKIYHN